MTQLKSDESNNLESLNSNWKLLYKIAGWSAFGMVMIIPLQIMIFVVWPPPTTVTGWFELFQDNKLIGLLSFEFLFIIYGILSLPLSLSLFVILRKINQSLTAIFLALSIVGIIAVFAGRPAFDMLYLSDQYAAATTEAKRTLYLAAGEGMYAIWHGTAYFVSYVLGSINGLIISIVMMQSKIFHKAIAYIRIGSSIFDFCLFIPVVGVFISIFSVLLLMVWNILVALKLFRLGKTVKT